MKQRKFAYVPPHTFEFFMPGQACMDAEPGDIILIRGSGFTSKAIRGVTSLRVPKGYAWTNHCAVVLSPGANATVSQEGAKGNLPGPISDLDMETYAVIHITSATQAQIDDAMRFANWSLDTGYSYLSDAADLFNAVTGLELCLSLTNHMCCSTSACRTAERMGLIPDKAPSAVSPADMAFYFDVKLPA